MNIIKQEVRNLSSIKPEVEYLIIRDVRKLCDLRHLKKLRVLDCAYNRLDDIKWLPENLEELYCNNNNIEFIDLTHNKKLKILCCSGNTLLDIVGLPESIERLVARSCFLMDLEKIPKNCVEIDLRDNEMTRLPIIPDKVRKLNLSMNYGLKHIYISGNIDHLDVSYTNIKEIRPHELLYLNCSENMTYLTSKYSKISRIEVNTDYKLKFISPLIKRSQLIVEHDFLFIDNIIKSSKLKVINDFLMKFIVSHYIYKNKSRKIICSAIKQFHQEETMLFKVKI